MSHGRAALYLQIPAEYCRSFGGLRWAHYGEAIEFLEGPTAGRTFAFAAEVAAFLEGLDGAGGSLPGFGFVLHLLYLVGLGDRAARHGERRALCVERIAGPFRGTRLSVAQCRALVFVAEPRGTRAADPPELAELHEILTGGSWVPQMVLSHPLLGRDGSSGGARSGGGGVGGAGLPGGQRTFRRGDPALAAAWPRSRAGRCRASRCHRGRGAWRRRWPSWSEAPGSPGLGGW